MRSVWSGLGEHNREICAIFNIHFYVGKWEGESALRETLAKTKPLDAIEQV